MAGMKINVSESSLPINGRHFPAKLWHLANDPEIKSVLWSPSGDGVIINQHKFEIELMSPEQESKVFKTTNFNSIIRQLNLYGFRKATHAPRDPDLHHFQNANFKRSQPDLLLKLIRRIFLNRAKVVFGEKVTCRAPKPLRQKSQQNTAAKKTGSVQHHRTDSHQLYAYDRTPIPPQSWMFHHGDVSPFYTNKGFPFYSFRGYPPNIPHGIVSSPTTMLLHQEPTYTYLSNYYPPAICQYSRSCIMETDRTISDQYSYLLYRYFPQNYLMSESQNYIETQAQIPNNWNDAYLERTFHMGDELQSSPDDRMVRVGSPVKAHHSSGLPESSEAGLCTSPVGSKLDSFSSKSFSSSSVLELDSCDIVSSHSSDKDQRPDRKAEF